MKDWKFLLNRYINRLKIDDGYKWDFPKHGMLISHDEAFLDDIILKNGDVFVDIGANVGAWAIRASPYYREVHAFEPNPVFHQALRRNIYLNNRGNIFTNNLALDNTNGHTLQSVVPVQSVEKPMGQSKVKTSTLDNQRFGDVSVIKIDAEGAGFRIIEGGIQTILNGHPKIIVEVHSKDESEIPHLLPNYSWQKRYRDMPQTGDWLYRENGQQVFLIGKWS